MTMGVPTGRAVLFASGKKKGPPVETGGPWGQRRPQRRGVQRCSALARITRLHRAQRHAAGVDGAAVQRGRHNLPAATRPHAVSERPSRARCTRRVIV
jgi:hypothetical protein